MERRAADTDTQFDKQYLHFSVDYIDITIENQFNEFLLLRYSIRSNNMLSYPAQCGDCMHGISILEFVLCVQMRAPRARLNWLTVMNERRIYALQIPHVIYYSERRYYMKLISMS